MKRFLDNPWHVVLSPNAAFVTALFVDGIACAALVARFASARVERDPERPLLQITRALAPLVLLTAALVVTLTTARDEREGPAIALLALGCMVSLASTYFVIRRLEAVLRPNREAF